MWVIPLCPYPLMYSRLVYVMAQSLMLRGIYILIYVVRHSIPFVRCSARNVKVSVSWVS